MSRPPGTFETTGGDPSTARRRDAVVGVALAGGRSRRMGIDKTALSQGRGTLLEWAVERLERVCSQVVVADRGRSSHPRSVEDGPGEGPVAGILGAARAHPARPLLVLAADLPNVPAPLLCQLATAADEGVDWLVPRLAGHLEPLCALYGPAAIAALVERVRSGCFALHSLAAVGALRLRMVDEGWLERFGDPTELFLNLNTPEELARWRRSRRSP